MNTLKMETKEKIARKNLLRKGKEVKGVKIKGYDFDKGINYKEIINSFSSMGFQASNLALAINIVRKMIKNKAFIFLGYTSNMVSSGNRDIIKYLVKHKKVQVCVTTCGGVEEDIIKCLGDFVLGDFNVDGKKLRKKGINRIGNIFVSNNLYIKFEEFLQPLLEEVYNKNKIISPSELIWKIGERINNEDSICYWAWKNKIRIFCPAIGDGALGDNIYFFKHKKNDFIIDINDDIKLLNDTTVGLRKSGVIILGTGIVKHSILNANMLRNGADYSIYINTKEEYDGSDSGARPDEAISWGKIKTESNSKSGIENKEKSESNSNSVKVFGDATILFPILVAKVFGIDQKKHL